MTTRPGGGLLLRETDLVSVFVFPHEIAPAEESDDEEHADTCSIEQIVILGVTFHCLPSDTVRVSFLDKKKTTRQGRFFFFVPPAGIGPTSLVPKTNALSIELRRLSASSYGSSNKRVRQLTKSGIIGKYLFLNLFVCRKIFQNK